MNEDKSQGKATDLVKKALTVGVGAIFLTEEGLRSLVSDIKLPKELLGGVMESATKMRRDFLKNLSEDVMEKIQDKMDVTALVEEILSRNEINLNISVDISPKTDAKKK